MSKEFDAQMKKLMKKSEKEYKKNRTKIDKQFEVQDTLVSPETKRMVTYALLGTLFKESVK